jgi:hypothetical protein
MKGSSSFAHSPSLPPSRSLPASLSSARQKRKQTNKQTNKRKQLLRGLVIRDGRGGGPACGQAL